MSNPYSRISEKKRPVQAGSARRAAAKKAAQRRVAVRPRDRFTARRDEGLFDEKGTFNPQRFERGKSAGSNRRMFNKEGEVNAIDRKDALTQTYHLLNNVTKKNADVLSAYNPDSAHEKLSKEARRDILAAALNDDEGFRLVGQELALPIKAILDYEGFARKVYRVRKLGQAELFRIPLDIRSTAWVIGQDGQTPEARIKTRWILPDETKITSFPSIDIHDLYLMNFDVLERAQDTARQEIELAEDKRAVALLDTAAQTDNAVTTYATLGIGAFEDVRYQVERHRLSVEHFLINRAEASDVVKTMSAAVDPVTERELILAGYIGNILNAQILTTAGIGVEEVIPAGTFYACTGADYLGEMGVRVELFSEPYNKFNQQETVKGWCFCEIVGFCVANSRSVAKGEK